MVGPSDFALLRVVNEGCRTPVFLMLRKMHRNGSQCWLFLHLVVILTLFDLLSFPFRCLLCRKATKRLLLRYQLHPREDKISDDLITDIVLGPAVSPAAIALDIVVPGQDVKSTELKALQSLLSSGDATGFKELAHGYETPKSLEPLSCAAEYAEQVKAAAKSVQAVKGALKENGGPGASQKWVQAYIHFDGRVPLYFIDWQWGTWFWYTGRRYWWPLGFVLMFLALLGNLMDLAFAPFVGIAYLLTGTKMLKCDEAGKNEVKAYLYTHDQGGEGVEYKTEGYMTVLRSDYHGPSYITGFNKCCRGSYQRWGKEELLRCFHVPQEVKLYKDFSTSHMTPTLTEITREEMWAKMQNIQAGSCCC